MVSRPALHKHGGQALQSATKTVGKKDGGQALDLLTIAQKNDSNKPALNCLFQPLQGIKGKR